MEHLNSKSRITALHLYASAKQLTSMSVQTRIVKRLKIIKDNSLVLDKDITILTCMIPLIYFHFTTKMYKMLH